MIGLPADAKRLLITVYLASFILQARKWSLITDYTSHNDYLLI